MSKITFRADDDLVERLEAFDASKSEVMREALRAYLNDGVPSDAVSADEQAVTDAESVDGLIAERVDEIIADRVDDVIAERLGRTEANRQPHDVNVNISLSGDTDDVTAERTGSAQAATDAAADVSQGREGRKTGVEERDDAGGTDRRPCAQCGETLSDDHVYCPNCGEKASRRVFCDCGDELRSDWGFCPSCGRRTPAADVLDQTRSGANER